MIKQVAKNYGVITKDKKQYFAGFDNKMMPIFTSLQSEAWRENLTMSKVQSSLLKSGGHKVQLKPVYLG